MANSKRERILSGAKSKKPIVVQIDMDEGVAAASREFEFRMRQPYDGILGNPPEWVPLWHRRRFWDLRDNLLRIYSLERARQFLYLELTPSAHPNARLGWRKIEQIGVPEEAFTIVKELAEIFRAVEAGDDAGLRQLAGPFAVQGRKKVLKLNAAREKAYGTDIERQLRYEHLQEIVDRLRHSHPDWTTKRIETQAAKEGSCSSATIHRRCRVTPKVK